jgi:type I restriction enzyme, S subunit
VKFEQLVLGDSLDLLIDNRGKNPPYEASGVPVVSGMSVRQDGLDLRESKFASHETWVKWMPNPTRCNDVIMTSEAPLGRVALVRTNDPMLIAQRVFGLRGRTGVLDSRFLYYALQSSPVQAELASRATGSTVLGIRQPELLKVRLSAPDFAQQTAIARVLGALDDKITANERLVEAARSLASARFVGSLNGGTNIPVSDAVSMLSRGVTPSYIEGPGMTVLNQKCVRNQRVSLDQARWMAPLSNRLNRILQKNDVLVNSTGVGTLGRVARWTREHEATVDSHVTIVRFNETVVDPVCAGFALLRLENKIEALAEGSTGQTELRRELLGSLILEVPSRSEQVHLGQELDELDALERSKIEESKRLARARDELLPLLMFGKLRVKDAEAVASEML